VTTPAQLVTTGAIPAATVDISETVGAPSATVVVTLPQLPSSDGCVGYLRRAYPELARGGVAFTKVLFVAPSTPAQRLWCRFIQLIGAGPHSFTSAETGRDCLNSMVAAAPTAYRMMRYRGYDGHDPVVVRNVDTGLAIAANVAADGVDVQVIPPRPLVPADTVIRVPGVQRRSLVLGVNNPYLVIDGASFGLSQLDLMELRGAPPAQLHNQIRTETDKVQACLGLPTGKDLPKVALVRSDGPRLAARTIYLGSWHPGLPLTGAVNFLVAALIPGSPWHQEALADNVIEIQTPGEVIRIGMSRNSAQGAITSFTIPNRKVVAHVESIEI
jgi:hypothetical protein